MYIYIREASKLQARIRTILQRYNVVKEQFITLAKIRSGSDTMIYIT